MFTGIITHIGTVARIEKSGDWKFTIEAPGITRGLKIGASVACSGVCLTVIRKDSKGFTVQVSQETLACTSLGNWHSGTRVNLERALKAGDELGGHFVSGHVDGVVTLDKVEMAGESKVLWFSLNSKALRRFVVPKGSATMDGVSLTVNQVKGRRFSVNIIPHTQKSTTLGERKKGDVLNFEPDMLGRFAHRR